MQVNYIDNIIQSGSEVFQLTETGKSSQFQTLFQEKITPPGDNLLASEISATEKNSENQRVCLGTLSPEHPTVSHLLYASSHKDKCWNILAREVNADKPFTRIPSGTPIFMDTHTSEILWGSSVSETPGNMSNLKKQIPENKPPVTPMTPDRNMDVGGNITPSDFLFENVIENTTISPSVIPEKLEPSSLGLDEAVGAFIGTSYSRMNCYELVVGGLKRMGVQYGGAHGLSRHLVQQAYREGKSSYSLHSGEGLIRAIGSDVFMETIPRVTRVNSQARAVMKKITDVLQEGQILSFSTPTRGHTGVISKKGENWTFINSGVMDHNMAGKNGGKAVGEERLNEEIKNWLRRAQKEGNALTITLGEVDSTKLSRFQRKPTVSLSQRV